MSKLAENKTLSIIIPAFNEEQMIPLTYEAVSKCMVENSIPFEIVFVDDGSKDKTYEQIEAVAEKCRNEYGTLCGHEDDQNQIPGVVKGVSFSRNFGKESAIMAGLREATGACCVVMDCDLQHPIETVPEMYALWNAGYEVVEGVKSDRGQESAIHRGFAKLFYSIISSMSDIDMKDTSDFKLLDRVAVDTLLAMPERAPFFRGMSQWIGFKSTRISYEVAERTVGESKWSFSSLVKYAIHNITTFSAKPMNLVVWLGVVFIVFGFLTAIEALVRYFQGTAAAGFTTVICLIFIATGFIMLSLGIIGYYIAQIYDEIKARPRYIVRLRCTSAEDNEVE